ncbi:15686_t:CDS:2, partial [Cetraspora pellucida]
FLAKLRLYLQNQGVNLADNAGGPPTGREFDEEITTKQNWELANLLDNTGQANIVAVNRCTAIQIGANRINKALNQPGNAIVKLRAVEANYRPEELRKKFLDALPLPWLEKAEDISEHFPLDKLAKKLYEIELCRIARHKRDRIPNPL